MSELKKFRLINKIEGYSFLLLLFIAMPLKYLAGLPIATKIAGMLHGILFIAFIYQLVIATEETPFSKKEAFIFFIASIIPFGSFYTESICKTKEN
jgi:integral membrane protein